MAYVQNNGGFIRSVNGKVGEVVLNANDVGALPASTSIPTKTSDLTNDSGFINNTINNLTNYYLKTDTYTKAEVNNLIGSISTLSFLVVQALPTQDIQTNVIYLVPKNPGEVNDVYIEYIYINNAWEKIGDTSVDLSNYYNKTEVDGKFDALADVASSGSYTDLTNKPTIPTALADLSEDNTHKVVTAAEKATWNGKSDFSGSYNDLTNKPTIPTALSQLTEDSTHKVVTAAEKATWNGKSDFSGSYDDLTDKPTIPTALSQLTEDSTHKVVTAAEKTAWNGKSDFSGSYDDLTDKPTIPTALSQLTEDSTHKVVTATEKATWNGKSDFSGSYEDLTDKPTIPAAQVNSDWSASSGVAQILNKPTIPTALSQLSEDSTHKVVTATEKTTWNGKVSDSPTFSEASSRTNLAGSNETFATILGKIKKWFSDLKGVAFSGSYNDLSDKPTIPSAQVNSDWNATTGVAKILNKPTIPAAQVNADWNATSGVAQILNKPTIPDVSSCVKTSNATMQTVVGTGTDTPLKVQGNATDAYMGFQGSPSGTTYYLGIANATGRPKVYGIGDLAFTSDINTYGASNGITLTVNNNFKVGTRWNSVTRGNRWSRLYWADAININEGTSGILAISCTRTNVVVNLTFLITTGYTRPDTVPNIIQLACNYYWAGSLFNNNVKCRLVYRSNGDYYFEVYDDLQNISTDVEQTWHCCFIPLNEAKLTTYTTYTSGESVPSNYTAGATYTCENNSDVSAIKKITRSGTTFTATRQDGSTFTFTQQDTTYSNATQSVAGLMSAADKTKLDNIVAFNLTVLWTNPSPTSDFDAQTINLSTNAYRFYEIIYKNTSSGTRYRSTGLLPAECMYGTLSRPDTYFFQRNYDIVNTGDQISFTACSRITAYGNSGSTTQNGHIIPYQVLGIL